MLIKNSKILLIQTAFIGDVILATPIIEAINNYDSSINIDILIRKGNENLLHNHPKINKLWIWDKKQQKTKNQWSIIRKLQKENYDIIINLQRFLSSGLFTVFSNAKHTIGFDKNPLSFRFNTKVKHIINKRTHEVDRNLGLLKSIIPNPNGKMRLYPSKEDFNKVKQYKTKKYIVIAPTSVWYTKQFPANKWIDFINKIEKDINIYLIGGPDDRKAIESIKQECKSKNIFNLSGDLNLLQSAALMKDATMNYVNDSAPLHIASAMNAPTTAIFCSTITDFGFGPQSTDGITIKYNEELSCKPCGLHGRKECKEGHFDCANRIETQELLDRITY